MFTGRWQGTGSGCGASRGDSQKADVQRIMDSRKATFESLRERARTDWQALHDLSSGSAPDRAAVGAAFLKLQADRDALRAERQSAMQEVRSILTPEQKEKLDTMQQERKERFSRRGMQGAPGRSPELLALFFCPPSAGRIPAELPTSSPRSGVKQEESA